MGHDVCFALFASFQWLLQDACEEVASCTCTTSETIQTWAAESIN